jgi:putative transposase
MTYTFIAQRCGDLPVVACCRVMGVSTSGFYAWVGNPVSERDWSDAMLTNTMFDIHVMSRRSYGSPRVHAELVLGQGQRCSRKRVARLMAGAGIVGIHRRKNKGCTRRDPDAVPAEDLVPRNFNPSGPDRLWVMDVTEHRPQRARYLAVVLDAWSRRVVGWSIADHIRSELVVDAVQMAIWRRCPPKGQTVAHSDYGPNTRRGPSVAGSGLLSCSARWGRSVNASLAMFDWIETWYNPSRRHSYCAMLSPVDFEQAHTPAAVAA